MTNNSTLTLDLGQATVTAEADWHSNDGQGWEMITLLTADDGHRVEQVDVIRSTDPSTAEIMAALDYLKGRGIQINYTPEQATQIGQWVHEVATETNPTASASAAHFGL